MIYQSCQKLLYQNVINVFFIKSRMDNSKSTSFTTKPKENGSDPCVLSPSAELNSSAKHAAQMNYHSVCLKTIISLDLCLGEGTNQQVSHIDSDRMFVHIHRCKPHTVNQKCKLQIVFPTTPASVQPQAANGISLSLNSIAAFNHYISNKRILHKAEQNISKITFSLG